MNGAHVASFRSPRRSQSVRETRGSGETWKRNFVIDSRVLNKQEMFAELAKLPDPPSAFGDLFSLSIPDIAAIYFLYNEGRLEYVGKSVNLHHRVGGLNALHHHAIENGDEISWIQFDCDDVELAFIECFYIWLCRPGRNFGRKDEAFHRRLKLRRNDGEEAKRT